VGEKNKKKDFNVLFYSVKIVLTWGCNAPVGDVGGGGGVGG
jgi:hypothetical protein